jgi:hypothetical protein
MRLTLCENMRAVPYVPFYLALADPPYERLIDAELSQVTS